MSGLERALAEALARALCHAAHVTGYVWCRRHRNEAAAILADPTFREALIREMADAMHEYEPGCQPQDRCDCHDKAAAALVARLLPGGGE